MHQYDGHFELIDPTEIHFDRRYQRAEKWDLIAKIADDPAWAAFGVVICSKREYANGLLCALDGQQRTLGVLSSKDPPKAIPVVWFLVKSVAEEAALFDKINTARKTVSTLEKFKSRLTAELPTYERIAAAVERAGYAVASGQSPLAITSVGKLETIYNAAGEEGVEIVLTAWREAWPDERPNGKMLGCLADVISDMSTNGGLSVERLAKGLARTTIGRIERRAEQIKYDQGISRRAAVRKAFKELAKL